LGNPTFPSDVLVWNASSSVEELSCITNRLAAESRKEQKIEERGQISIPTSSIASNRLDWLATVETTSFTYRSRWSTEIKARQSLLKWEKSQIFFLFLFYI
jgi:hypothetical protein